MRAGGETMSDNYIIEIRPNATGVTVQAGVVVRDGQCYRFFADACFQSAWGTSVQESSGRGKGRSASCDPRQRRAWPGRGELRRFRGRLQSAIDRIC
jgi:hypothetical protein